MRKMRKKAQKTINKHTRALNKNLREDYLWRGRFYVHQIASDWEKFEDNSGGELICILEIRDKKTGLFKTFRVNNYDVRFKLWEIGNNFIVQDSGVWDDISAVKNDTTDWSKIKWNPIKEVH